MVNIATGDILDSGANIICHQTNCLGVMGAGLALQIKRRYPDVFTRYKAYCDFAKRPEELLGTSLLVPITQQQQYIANCFGQLAYGRVSQQTNYAALKKSLTEVRDFSEEHGGLSVAIPFRIGCGLAGGQWHIVKKLIDEVFGNSSFDATIWYLPE